MELLTNPIIWLLGAIIVVAVIETKKPKIAHRSRQSQIRHHTRKSQPTQVVAYRSKKTASTRWKTATKKTAKKKVAKKKVAKKTTTKKSATKS